MSWIASNWGYIFGVLFAISELLAQIPAIQANSIFQLIVNGLKALKPGTGA